MVGTASRRGLGSGAGRKPQGEGVPLRVTGPGFLPERTQRSHCLRGEGSFKGARTPVFSLLNWSFPADNPAQPVGSRSAAARSRYCILHIKQDFPLGSRSWSRACSVCRHLTETLKPRRSVGLGDSRSGSVQGPHSSPVPGPRCGWVPCAFRGRRCPP